MICQRNVNLRLTKIPWTSRIDPFACAMVMPYNAVVVFIKSKWFERMPSTSIHIVHNGCHFLQHWYRISFLSRRLLDAEHLTCVHRMLAVGCLIAFGNNLYKRQERLCLSHRVCRVCFFMKIVYDRVDIGTNSVTSLYSIHDTIHTHSHKLRIAGRNVLPHRCFHKWKWHIILRRHCWWWPHHSCVASVHSENWRNQTWTENGSDVKANKNNNEKMRNKLEKKKIVFGFFAGTAFSNLLIPTFAHPICAFLVSGTDDSQ